MYHQLQLQPLGEYGTGWSDAGTDSVCDVGVPGCGRPPVPSTLVQDFVRLEPAMALPLEHAAKLSGLLTLHQEASLPVVGIDTVSETAQGSSVLGPSLSSMPQMVMWRLLPPSTSRHSGGLVLLFAPGSTLPAALTFLATTSGVSILTLLWANDESDCQLDPPGVAPPMSLRFRTPPF